MGVLLPRYCLRKAGWSEWLGDWGITSFQHRKIYGFPMMISVDDVWRTMKRSSSCFRGHIVADVAEVLHQLGCRPTGKSWKLLSLSGQLEITTWLNIFEMEQRLNLTKHYQIISNLLSIRYPHESKLQRLKSKRRQKTRKPGLNGVTFSTNITRPLEVWCFERNFCGCSHHVIPPIFGSIVLNV